MQRQTYKIDALDRAPGRIATEVATLLQGKNKPDWDPSVDSGGFVQILNVDKMRITGNKKEGKIYYRHSGYPGGLTETKMKDMSPENILRNAVKNMLPKNKLRSPRMQRLRFVK